MRDYIFLFLNVDSDVYVRLLKSDYKIALIFLSISGFTDFQFGFNTRTKISLVRLPTNFFNSVKTAITQSNGMWEVSAVIETLS